jgi:hypothetical protein
MGDRDVAQRPHVYTVKQAAELAGVDIKTGYTAVKLGQWPAIKIGRIIRVAGPAFDRLLREGERAA